MPRFFTLRQAEHLLPEVERLLRSLMELKEEYECSEGELDRIGQRIALAGGMVPPRERIAELRGRKDTAARSVKSKLERMKEIGCELKDIDAGLVDFPTLYKDKEVYLCWKLGESGIGFWHQVEDGYRGRWPIDGEFRANHRGDDWTA